MEVMKLENQILQWHPAFFASVQIEMGKEAAKVFFESEHQLGTKPKEIDVLIIKKESETPIQKNIGRIFRKHNIVEYKSPEDYMSVNDFYKVYAYACFYKADEGNADSIKIDDITISIVCHTFPYKLIHHLEDERGYKIHKVEEGIYYIIGDKIPIQIILTRELSKEHNFWLRSLTNDLKEPSEIEQLIREYEKKKENKLYESVMDIIVRANREKFQEVKTMCGALEELMKDELEAKRAEGRELEILNLICKKLRKGKSPQSISQELEEDCDIIADICRMAEDLAPEYNCDLLFEKLHNNHILLR